VRPFWATTSSFICGSTSWVTTSIPGIRVEVQSLLLSLEVGFTAVEAGLTGAQDLELSPEGDVVQLLPLL
jgi:hypothetical protein